MNMSWATSAFKTEYDKQRSEVRLYFRTKYDVSKGRNNIRKYCKRHGIEVSMFYDKFLNTDECGYVLFVFIIERGDNQNERVNKTV